eukprot:CAMPEP_0172381310 /NCGR_PEP_ID=MMETSP1060-20121228/70877_1 /TAXON_ID=37318 /ORGANISM="Pseudo-nitzschia pungens, Strain cf. cingulata" /LENGTH=671 /DNA_ID=CAMNT_0013109079 /DNA_START=102 /DNA_END=2117 /DNA_ORIENTATION=-
MSTALKNTTRTIDIVKKDRLELGRKVFKVPVPSKRRSARRATQCQWQKSSSKIEHHLLLGPTLKRQRKKRLEREKENKKCSRTRTKEDRKMFLTSVPEKEIRLSDVFHKKLRHRSKQRVSRQTNNAVYSTTTPKKIMNRTQMRQLARCGGIKRVLGLKTTDENPLQELQKSSVPPPFEPKFDDPYIVPQPGQLISYLWHTRPNPVHGAKRIYRTGVLCSTDGTIRFFKNESDRESESGGKPEAVGERKFFESKFYLNKRVFNNGNFRVRTDLVEGAICYEREIKLPCKLVKIDQVSGAVFVESLSVQDGDLKASWISPDDLVGNYKFSTASHIQNSNGEQNGCTHERSDGSADKTRTTIDLTHGDEYQSNLISLQAKEALKVSNDPHLIPETDSNHSTVNPSSTQTTYETPTSWYRSMGIGNPLSNTQDVRSTSTLAGRDFGNLNAHYNTVANGMIGQSTLQTVPQSPSSSYLLRTGRTPVSERSTFSSSLDFSVRGRTLQETFTRFNDSAFTQMTVNLVKQQDVALQILVSSEDLPTIMVCLQIIQRTHQRGIPLGPTAREVVLAAEKSSYVLMEESFLKHMTTQLFARGRGYSFAYAKAILYLISPILGPTLGSLDCPSTSLTKLRSLGLNESEAPDAHSWIQSIEDDVLLKSISLKRQLEHRNMSFGD